MMDDEATTAPEDEATAPEDEAATPDDEAATAPDDEAATAPEDEAATPDDEAATGALLLKGAPLLLPGLDGGTEGVRLLVDVNVALVHSKRTTRLLAWSTTNKKTPGNSFEYATSHGVSKAWPLVAGGAPDEVKSGRPITKEAEDPFC
jgi:hypothetical protein